RCYRDWSSDVCSSDLVQVGPRITEAAAKQEPTNGPGRPDRPNGRAPAIEREARVQPRRLGHVVIGSLDQEASQRFFTEGLGFKEIGRASCRERGERWG